jgi:hypothetical protein
MSPEVFGQDGDIPDFGEAELCDDEQIRLVQQIAACCPTGAILVIVEDNDDPAGGSGTAAGQDVPRSAERRPDRDEMTTERQQRW